MSKKFLYIITAVVLGIVFLIGGWFIYSASKGGSPVQDLKKLVGAVSPFGESDPFGIRKVLNSVKSTIPGFTTETTTQIPENSAQVMFKLSEKRSSGIAFADVLVPRTREVLKRITIDDPRVAPGGVPKKIQTTATTTETYYATTTRVRYVEQGSGHIYEHDHASSTTRKLTNTTIPKTSEAYFLDNGSKVLLRYLDNTNRRVENYLASIPNSSVADQLTGTFLSNNITALSVSPNTSEFFYIAKTSSGSVGNIYNTRTNTERRVFSSLFSEWLPDWVQNGIYLTTKPSNSVPGFMYQQSLQKNALTRTTGNKLGLTSLSNKNGTRILLGEGAKLSVLNISSGETVPVIGLYTLPEKCVWTTDEEFLCFGSEDAPTDKMPDSWYQGLTFFNDALFSVYSIDGSSLKVATMEELYTKKVVIDGTLPRLSRDGFGLVFLNKIDMSPWYVDIGTLYGYIQP